MTVGTASLRQAQAAPMPAAAHAATKRPNVDVLLANQRLSRHKALPHPTPKTNGNAPGPAVGEKPTLHQHPPVRVLQHPAPGRIAKSTLPDPPPTPPAYSRSSSGTHSARPSSPTYVEPAYNDGREGDDDDEDGDEDDEDDADTQRPETPSHQNSPPTPDVTPPLPSRRPRAVRPDAGDRIESKGAVESRSESFRTVPEDPWSSVEDNVGYRDARLGVQLKGPSTKTSQSTVRPDYGRTKGGYMKKTPQPRPIGLGLGLGLGLESPTQDTTPPKTLFSFDDDNDRDSEHEVEKEWDDNLQRNVVMRKRRPRMHDEQVIETRLVSPTIATRALRGLNLQEKMDAFPAPRNGSVPNRPESSINGNFRRFSGVSGVSTHSTASTVVEAILVDAPSRRQRTLRHVRKNAALRDSGSDMSMVSASVVSSAATDRSGSRAPLRSLPANRPDDVRSRSIVSNNSISSRSARRDIWKNGGIPVVVVPTRSSSRHSDDDTPSLRSSSNRRRRRVDSTSSSKRPKSLAPSTVPSMPPLSGDWPGRRSRRMSDSGRPECTIDFPPTIPQRSSSLSAPTSRNVSRAGSMKEDSQTALNALLQIHITKAFGEQGPQDQDSPQPPESPVLPSPSRRPLSVDSEVARNRLSLDAKRLAVHNTPFSMVSFDTNITGVTNATSNAEVSEATIVTLHPHQNSSVLVVDHRPGSDELGEPQNVPPEDMPVSRYTPSTGPAGPVTPPRRLSFDDVDSPLRNPRAPPEPPTNPPALALTLATPSGYTPANEKRELMGNYFEVTGQKAPSAGSMVRRALSLTRKSENNPPLSSGRPAGLLRTWSLTRHLGRSQKASRPDRIVYPTDDKPPPEEDKLHPYYEPPCSGCDDPECDAGRSRAVQQVRFRLPAKPTLGDRVRKTLASLPRIEHATGAPTSRPPTRPAQRMSGRGSEPPARPGTRGRRADSVVEDEPVEEGGPDRREIRRTPSGNLRVMRRRRSIESPMRAQFRPYEEAMPSRRSGTWRCRNSLAGSYEEYRPDNTSVGNGGAGAAAANGSTVSRPPLSGNGINPIEKIQGLSHRLRECGRERRSRELRRKISKPQEFRDPVQEVLRPRNNTRRPLEPVEIPGGRREPEPDDGSDRGRLREWQRGYPNQSQTERSRDRERRRYEYDNQEYDNQEYDNQNREDDMDGFMVGRAL